LCAWCKVHSAPFLPGSFHKVPHHLFSITLIFMSSDQIYPSTPRKKGCGGWGGGLGPSRTRVGGCGGGGGCLGPLGFLGRNLGWCFGVGGLFVFFSFFCWCGGFLSRGGFSFWFLLETPRALRSPDFFLLLGLRSTDRFRLTFLCWSLARSLIVIPSSILLSSHPIRYA